MLTDANAAHHITACSWSSKNLVTVLFLIYAACSLELLHTSLSLDNDTRQSCICAMPKPQSYASISQGSLLQISLGSASSSPASPGSFQINSSARALGRMYLYAPAPKTNHWASRAATTTLKVLRRNGRKRAVPVSKMFSTNEVAANHRASSRSHRQILEPCAREHTRSDIRIKVFAHTLVCKANDSIHWCWLKYSRTSATQYFMGWLPTKATRKTGCELRVL